MLLAKLGIVIAIAGALLNILAGPVLSDVWAWYGLIIVGIGGALIVIEGETS